jgi:hypothetical protein
MQYHPHTHSPKAGHSPMAKPFEWINTKAFEEIHVYPYANSLE